LWSHNFVASEDDNEPELATNDEWRKIMVRARKTHGLTQEQLADEFGVSQVTISKIESGAFGSSKLVLPISRRLKIPEPQHFADNEQREWSQLGHVLRHHGGAEYDAALQLLRSMVKRIEGDQPADLEKPDPEAPRRK
jgi:transcriptional regulator with XRE-family HTH domain